MNRKSAPISKTAYKRHVVIYRVFRVLLRPWITHKFNLTAETAKIPDDIDTYIVLSNHTTDWDPILLPMSFSRHMYFVASNHIFHIGILSKMLYWAQAPISRLKGVTATQTVMEVLRHLKAGHNICIFAEGCRSFDGRTSPILPSTGKLVKSTKRALVTYRFTGGYLTSPRWSASLRKGAIRGSVVHIYTPEQLAKMSIDEINTCIQQDLYVHAEELQRDKPVLYSGKNLAEYLETFLYCCPKCHSFQTLESYEDSLFCHKCDLKVRYDKYGHLNDSPIATISEWADWQKERLKEYYLASNEKKVIFEDQNVICKKMNEDIEVEQSFTGKLIADKDGFVFTSDKAFTIAFSYRDLSGVDLYGRNHLCIEGVKKVRYEFSGIDKKAKFNAEKYKELFQLTE